MSTVLIASAFVLAGFVKGMVGLGLPTVAIGLLGLMMSPAQAASLVVVPSLATNLWQLAAGPGIAALLRRLWAMLLGICVGTWCGAAVLGSGIDRRAGALLGVALVLYALFGLNARRFSLAAKRERWLSPLIGIATGMVTAATGVFVIPAVPYLQALGLGKEELVQALGLSFTVSTIALAIALAHSGMFQLSAAGASLMALAPAGAGMVIGQRLRRRVRPETFQLYFFAGLLLLGAHLALRAVL